jgi:phage baseplate assembly protein W
MFYSDFTSNFSVNPLTEQLAIVTNEQDVIDSIQRLSRLAPFEREYENIGGGVINQLLFEPISQATATALRGAIMNTISTYEPRATVQEIVVNAFLSERTYVVNITFSMINNPNPITFQMILKKIR